MKHVKSILEILRPSPQQIAVIISQGPAQIIAHNNGYKHGFGISVQHGARRFAVAGFTRRPSEAALTDAIFVARRYIEANGLTGE